MTKTYCVRPSNNAPKANTRFLKNIIKETDSHNAALRAKEARDSRAQLKAIKRGEHSKAKDGREDGRLETLGNGHRSKRRCLESDGKAEMVHSRGSRSSRHEHCRTHIKDDDRGRRHHHHRGQRNGDSGENERSGSPGHYVYNHRLCTQSSSSSLLQNGCLSRSRTPSPKRDSSCRRKYDHRARRRRDSDPPKIYEHRSRRRSGTGRYQDRPQLDKGYAIEMLSSKDTKSKAPCPSSNSESDPLDSIIGPPPPPPPPEPKVKPRGRGAVTTKSTSLIDNHFKTSYDPSNDAHPDPDLEADDWDQALEALRDRQKWQQQGAERLKAAGFSDEQVSKWASGKQGLGAVEKGEKDVRWRRKGEGREWDKGKVVTDDGIETGAGWGRLKGS